MGGIGNAGLFIWNRKTHSVQRFVYSGQDNSLPSNNITAIVPAAKNKFWISTEKGLTQFDFINKIFTNFLFKEYNNGDAVSINDIYRSGDDLWMTFNGIGLAKWNPQTDSFHLFGTKDGLTTNVLYNLRPDNEGNFWISSDNGLIVFIKQKQKFITYTVEDGIQENEFNRFCVYETKDKIYFGGISGLTSIDKWANPLLKNHPAIRITQVKYLDHNHYEEYKDLGISTLSLHPDQNDFILQYAALDPSTSHRMRYTYMLQNYDRNWIENGTATEVSYTNLPPGHYTFRVRLTNPEFVGEPQIASLPIYIAPAWYQTILFKVVLIASILLFLFFLVRWYYLARLQKQQMEYEKLLAVQMERQRISSEIHDDIGAGLSGIRLLSEMTSQKIQNIELRDEVNKIHSSISELSGKMREVIWSLNTDNDTLENLIYFLQRQTVQLFENSSIKVIVTMPHESIPEVSINGEKRRHILLIVKEALHNVIKHSHATWCQLTMNITNDILIIIVADNGKGLEHNKGNEWGNGMRNMNKRTNQVGGTVTIDGKTGTVLKFEIPITQNS